jgi:hypothetical protein
MLTRPGQQRSVVSRNRRGVVGGGGYAVRRGDADDLDNDPADLGGWAASCSCDSHSQSAAQTYNVVVTGDGPDQRGERRIKL